MENLGLTISEYLPLRTWGNRVSLKMHRLRAEKTGIVSKMTLQIDNAPMPVTPDNVSFIERYSAMDGGASSFDSPNATLNAVWDLMKHCILPVDPALTSTASSLGRRPCVSAATWKHPRAPWSTDGRMPAMGPRQNRRGAWQDGRATAPPEQGGGVEKSHQHPPAWCRWPLRGRAARRWRSQHSWKELSAGDAQQRRRLERWFTLR